MRKVALIVLLFVAASCVTPPPKPPADPSAGWGTDPVGLVLEAACEAYTDAIHAFELDATVENWVEVKQTDAAVWRAFLDWKEERGWTPPDSLEGD